MLENGERAGILPAVMSEADDKFTFMSGRRAEGARRCDCLRELRFHFGGLRTRSRA